MLGKLKSAFNQSYPFGNHLPIYFLLGLYSGHKQLKKNEGKKALISQYVALNQGPI